MPIQQIAVSSNRCDSEPKKAVQEMEGKAEERKRIAGELVDEQLAEETSLDVGLDNPHVVLERQNNNSDTQLDIGDDVSETETILSDDSESEELPEAASGANEKHIVVDTVIVMDRDSNGCLPVDTSNETPIQIPAADGNTDTSNNCVTQMSDKRSRSGGKSGKKEKPTPFKKKESQAKETLHPNSPTPMSTERCDSSLSMSVDACRICQCDSCEIQSDSPLVAPCLCAGSLKYIHQACLQKWIKSSDKMSCELCQFEYKMTKKTKPFREWERLEMTPAERRKVICRVTFHIVAITCVVWSLYVLIDRTTEEVEAGSLLWPFWTKLIVVAVGFTGGVVFMYVQCKVYLTYCKRWRMYNKVIMISSISDAQREKANHSGIVKISEKQAQLEGSHVTNLEVFNVVTETDVF